MTTRFTAIGVLLGIAAIASAAEYHVSTSGSDANAGTPGAPFRSIQRAAEAAQPGDTVTVHAGTYRERVNPPRGGTSDASRIIYQAAPGEAVTIKGSEVVSGWQHAGHDTWTVTLPAGFFGGFNPFNNLITGDYFTSNNRNHHSAAVYLNGHWLSAAASQSTVLQPASGTPQWFATVDGGGYLANVKQFQLFTGGTAGATVDASFFERDFGVINSTASEGGHYAGRIEDGDWTRYTDVDFGSGADSIRIRAAAQGSGGRVEVRLAGPTGTLLGTCTVTNTGGWQNWQNFTAPITPTSGTQTVCLVYRHPASATGSTTIWAQFPGRNPNNERVEVNARQTVFYPEETGVDYLTVRGFTLEQAATPWAPPTAEQIGLVGPNWSKGWIIENNTVRYSRCAGVSLGKYGDRWDNTATEFVFDGADAYVQTINRALENGWNKETVGSHIVRGNHIYHCEQVGVVGSLGSAFSTVENNTIHDCWVQKQFSGFEMAGIKFHGAIDTVIRRNHSFGNGGFGIWLDWMMQGTRVTRNLLHQNSQEDLFMEVNHGPFMVDHNIFLSALGLFINSQGGTYAHNLVAGAVKVHTADSRQTPYHLAHSTAVAGLHDNPYGDMRFYNNIFVQPGQTTAYNSSTLPMWLDGNVYLKGAASSTQETSPLVLPSFNPDLRLASGFGGYYLQMNADPAWATARVRPLVTTAMLGNASIPNLPFEQADGSPYRLDIDYLASARNAANPFPGPFETVTLGTNTWKVFDDASVSGPSGLTATSGISRVVLNWNPYMGATGYTVKRGTTSGGPYTTVAANVTDTTWIDTAVIPGTTYYYVVSASDGAAESAHSTEAAVTPANAIRINCGGPASGGFSADTWYSTGTPYTSGTAVSTTGVTHPAPAAVYQSERYGVLDYTAPGLDPGTNYLVRLHFAEIYLNSAGGRVWNVLINGATVLPDFDAFAAAGGANKAVVREFTATADSQGRITISLAAVVSNPKISGFEILPLTAPDAPTSLNATPGFQQVDLEWAAAPGAAGYKVWRSGAQAGPFTQVGTTATTRFTDQEVTNGLTYYYSVTATNTYGESPHSETVAATPNPPPTAVWSNPAGGSWAVAGNWLDHTIASDAGVVADFSTLDLTAEATVTLDGARTVGKLVFGDSTPSHAWFLDTGSGGPLTLAATFPPQIGVHTTATISAVLAGTNGLVKSGTGVLTLSGTNTYTGATTASQGTLIIAPTANVGTNGTLTQSSTTYSVADGATLRFDASNVRGGSAFAIWDINPVSISAGGTLELHSTNTLHDNVGANALLLYWGGTDQISGAGALTKEGGGVMALNGTGTLANFTGTLNVNGGTFAFQGGSTSTVGNFAVNIANGATLDIRTDNHRIGTLSGSGPITKSSTVNGTSTLTIGCDDGTGTYSGAIANPVGTITLQKAGTGTQVLSGALSYGGGTTVNNGTLVINGTSSNSNFTVASGGTLGGNGTITGTVAAASGGTVAPGSAGTGTLSLGSSATFAAGSSLAIELAPAAGTSDTLAVNGNLTLGSATLSLARIGDSQSAAGAKFTIATYTGTLTGTFNGVAEGSVVYGADHSFVVRYADGGKHVTLTTRPAYDTWIGANHPGLTGEDAQPWADPDGDGLANILEFVLDANPSSGSGTKLPAAAVQGGDLVFTYTRRDDSEYLNPRVEFASEIEGPWTIAVDGVNCTITVAEGAAAPDTVTVAIPCGERLRLFARLAVTIPA